jgi:hypothetical protein
MRPATLLLAPVLVLLLLCATAPAGAQSFADDFDRPDGPVGNGWACWRADTLGSADVRIASGALMMPGVDGDSAGVFRPLAAKFPIAFAFDFRTDDPHGGWYVALNGAVPSGPRYYPPFTPATVMFTHPAGLHPVERMWRTPDGEPVTDRAGAPGLATRSYAIDRVAQVTGTVDADLSAVFVIDYRDGLPPITVVFGAQPAADVEPAGPNFVLGSTAGGAVLTEPVSYYFDNLRVETLGQWLARPLLIQVGEGLGPKTINPRSRGTTKVTIFSEPDFDVVGELDYASLRFGRTGAETSVADCDVHTARDAHDAYRDTLPDLVCRAYTERLGLTGGETFLVLTARTRRGIAVSGRDAIRLRGGGPRE